MTPIVWFTVAMIAALAGTLTIAVYRTLTMSSGKTRFEEALTIIQSSELSELENDEEINVDDDSGKWSWNKYWLRTARQAGRVPDDADSPGRFALGALIGGSVFGFLVFPGGAGGIIVGIGLVVAGSVWLNWEAGKRRALLESQMPILLSSLRSQMHAGVTVQAALMSVADELPSPIGDEVRMVKRDVNVSIPLEQALDTLAQRVNSRQMQFLVASIGIAVRSGSDLVPQLVVIEEIVQQRARIEGKIKSAIALAKPTAILAMAAPVIMMLYMSFTDPGYLAWFFGPGILFLGISIGLYAAGVVTIRILVKNVENT